MGNSRLSLSPSPLSYCAIVDFAHGLSACQLSAQLHTVFSLVTLGALRHALHPPQSIDIARDFEAPVEWRQLDVGKFLAMESMHEVEELAHEKKE